MFLTTIVLLTGIATILYLSYLFIIVGQKKNLLNKGKYWFIEDEQRSIYFVKNLQMNVVNNFSDSQKISPIYLEENFENKYNHSKKFNIDLVID